ncbi:MAG: hypothetical protein IH822_09100 [Chloroflexi bacterium]|nr:hypothetical protein [Chloroflexota bacterium]
MTRPRAIIEPVTARILVGACSWADKTLVDSGCSNAIARGTTTPPFQHAE